MGTLGKRIKMARADLEITQESLAKRLGVARATVASWETGRRDPDTDTLYKISSICNVSVDWLLGKELPEEIDLVDILEKQNIKVTAGNRFLTPEERVKMLEVLDAAPAFLNKDKPRLDKIILDSDTSPGKLSKADDNIDIDKELENIKIAAHEDGRQILKPPSPELRAVLREVLLELMEEQKQKQDK
jgi:transcriptional regulator with XRE-family HTH domain